MSSTLDLVVRNRHLDSCDETQNQDPDVVLLMEDTCSSKTPFPCKCSVVPQANQSSNRFSRKKRRHRTLGNPNRKTETIISGTLDTLKLRTSSSGWMGFDSRRTIDGRTLVKMWHAGTIGSALDGFKLLHYEK